MFCINLTSTVVNIKIKRESKKENGDNPSFLAVNYYNYCILRINGNLKQISYFVSLPAFMFPVPLVPFCLHSIKW